MSKSSEPDENPVFDAAGGAKGDAAFSSIQDELAVRAPEVEPDLGGDEVAAPVSAPPIVAVVSGREEAMNGPASSVGRAALGSAPLLPEDASGAGSRCWLPRAST
jgi:hypothetical protein